ncbi:MAG: tRNA (N(6)-L-threonylcarbamoyladenosine(37)-C(2))-methylthiotransferase MtaB [Bacteroidales bacterium]|nr:tRNA (N(6)-L-threonylcarbamoyladenosine(37)-C(2))-methylthiotransferase MtaB [Bacteroidales bacterium]
MSNHRRKVAFYTLGCKLNFAETSTISRSFPEEQFEKVSPDSKADVYVINTCTVTDTADRKCRQAIRKFIQRSPEAVIAVVGCYAQLHPEAVSSIPGVDLILGNNEKFDVVRYLETRTDTETPEIHSCSVLSPDMFNSSFSVGDRTRSFLKIQDGCDYKCAYCTIPLARGPSRSEKIEVLIREAKRIADSGTREIVLTGVNIGDFGKSAGESLERLLEQLVKIPGIERLRLSSIEPNLITSEIIRLTANEEKILPHFHIPLQSGSDKVLKLMRRRYKRDLFSSKVLEIREAIPLAGIGADVIVGFPGETDCDSEDTYNFLSKMPVSYLHVFNFSERPGTPAGEMQGKIPFQIREQRSKKLISLSREKQKRFSHLNIGTITKVLFEGNRKNGIISGFTENYLKVEYPWDARLSGTIRKVRISGSDENDNLIIELID